MLGADLFARTLSLPTRQDAFGNQWQYHSRSDHHSKIACAVVMLDLLRRCGPLAAHAREGKIAFGVNHEMRDFAQNRKKNLDLVVCTPAPGPASERRRLTLSQMARMWRLALSREEEALIEELPPLPEAPVGSVLMALEAKACMTAHQKALPRLYDELNSSHLTVHGAAESAIAVGLVCVNAAEAFISPDCNKRPIAGAPTWSRHPQPKAARITLDKVAQIPRRSKVEADGYDALGVVVIDFKNDGSPARIVKEPPAPQPSEILHYDSMLDRICNAYTTRFRTL